MVLSGKLPEGRGVSDQVIQKKYEETLKAFPDDDKAIKDALSDIETIIKDKEVPDEVAEHFPKWDIGDFKEYAKYLKGEKKIKEEKKPEKEKSTGRFEPEMVRLFFMAPDNPSTETITPQGNFQWIGYELLFKKISPTVKHYKYRTPLWAYGEESEGGSQIVLDSEGEETKDFTVDEAKKALEKYRTVYPTGLSGFYYNVPKSMAGSKFDPDLWVKAGKKYTFDKFDEKFRKSGFYKLEIGRAHV